MRRRYYIKTKTATGLRHITDGDKVLCTGEDASLWFDTGTSVENPNSRLYLTHQNLCAACAAAYKDKESLIYNDYAE